MDRLHPLCSSVCQWKPCSHLSAIGKKAALNRAVQMSLRDPTFSSLGGTCPQRNGWILWGFYLSPLKKLPNSFQQWLHHLSALPATWESGSFSLSLPTLVITGVCDGSGPSGCEAASQPPWLWLVSLVTNDAKHLSIPGHLYAFLGERFIPIF